LSTGGLMVALSEIHTVQKALFNEGESGYYPSLRVASVMANVPSVLFPLMLVFNGGTYYTHFHSTSTGGDTDEYSLVSPGYLSPLSFGFLVVLLGILRVYSARYFAMIGVVTGRIVPPSYQDDAARIMTLGALYQRSAAPVVAGILVSVFMSWPQTAIGSSVNAFILWTVIGLVLGLGAAALTLRLRFGNVGTNTLHQSTRISERQRYLDNRQKAQVFVRLWDVHYDHGSHTPASKWRRMARKAIALNRLAGSGEAGTSRNAGVSREDTHPTATATAQTLDHRNRRASWADYSLRPGVNPDDVPFLILGTSKDDESCSPHILTPPLMNALHQQLPMSCSGDNFWLKYSLIRDGASLVAMYSKIVMTKNTIIAVETLEGDVFGCFMAKPWEKSGKFEMCGTSFLWRMRKKRRSTEGVMDEEMLDLVAREEGEIDIFNWTGENEDCQLLSDERIAVGSSKNGFAFAIEEGLWRGSSTPSQTYDSPQLVASPDGTFKVANIEVWTMTPFLFTHDAEQMDERMRVIRANVAPSTLTSSWTKYM